jgi:hypothetical protein
VLRGNALVGCAVHLEAVVLERGEPDRTTEQLDTSEKARELTSVGLYWADMMFGWMCVCVSVEMEIELKRDVEWV